VSVVNLPETNLFQGPNQQGNFWLGEKSGIFMGLS